MSRPLRIQYPGAVYHITHRGNERKTIFKDDGDRQHFLDILAQSISTYDIILHSYVLMNNHFHLLAETPLGNLSEFMRHFNISYTSYFNRRYRRSGNLYQGRYKSFVIDKATYLSTVSRYIHLNPVRIKSMLKKDHLQQLACLFDYQWSSLPGYLSNKNRQEFVAYEYVLDEFGGDTLEGLEKYKNRLVVDLTKGIPVRKKIVAQSILGDDDFVGWINETFLQGKNGRERPAIGRVHKYKKSDELLEIVSKELNTPQEELLHRAGFARQVAMDILYRYGGMKNPEIGKLMGVDYSTVSQGRKRLREKIAGDNNFQELMARLDSTCQE